MSCNRESSGKEWGTTLLFIVPVAHANSINNSWGLPRIALNLVTIYTEAYTFKRSTGVQTAVFVRLYVLSKTQLDFSAFKHSKHNIVLHFRFSIFRLRWQNGTLSYDKYFANILYKQGFNTGHRIKLFEWYFLFYKINGLISTLTEYMLNHTVDKLYYALMTLGGSGEAIVFVNGTENLGYRGWCDFHNSC